MENVSECSEKQEEVKVVAFRINERRREMDYVVENFLETLEKYSANVFMLKPKTIARSCKRIPGSRVGTNKQNALVGRYSQSVNT